ncbi:Acg family FMN-binding oxidoreductase [Isoptericola sp. BMS4]|uniref:Acg family FMN-binding oxidoreductase n=1 Tax=Isoptericola sp. BMS4 TaxID=2527875 RepID=UPI00141FA06D|nr:nitroreductase family protein [Isoptericola sp. BMS4]
MDVVDARVERIVESAGRAPSVHNTQPWRVRFDGSTLEVRADPARQLRHTDPQGREMLISCGAFLFNARTAARRESLRPRVRVLPDPADPGLVAVVDLDPGPGPETDELELAVAIQRRVTSRVPFDDQPLDVDVLEALRAAARDEGAGLRAVPASDPVREQVLALVRRAEALAAEDEVGVGEERAWTGGARSARPDGIPRDLLGPAAAEEGAPVRRFSARSGLVHFERRSTMAVLTTPGDSPRDWVAAGQALEHLLLVATTYFVHASFATTVLENPTTRHDLSTVLSLGAAPQMLMRLGYSARPARTPRRPVDDLVREHRTSARPGGGRRPGDG